MAKRLTSPYDRSVDYVELAGSVASLSPLCVWFVVIPTHGRQAKVEHDLSSLAVTASGRSTLDFQDEAAVR